MSQEWTQALVLAGIVAIAVLLSGWLIVSARTRGRTRNERREPTDSVVRSWLAITLVLGLLIFAAASFAVTDGQLQSTLIGAVAASAGAAVAYYFSAKGAEQAREAILSATFGVEKVPDLRGLTRATAAARLGSTAFKLEVDPAGDPADTAVVDSQQPMPDSTARGGTAIVVTLKPAPVSAATTGSVTP